MEYKVTPQLHEASPPTDFRAPVEKHVATPQKKNKKKKTTKKQSCVGTASVISVKVPWD